MQELERYWVKSADLSQLPIKEPFSQKQACFITFATLIHQLGVACEQHSFYTTPR